MKTGTAILCLAAALALCRPSAAANPTDIASIPHPPAHQVVKVKIDRHGRLTIDDKPVKRDRIEDALRVDSVTPDTVIAVDARANFDERDIAGILDGAHGVGVTRVSIGAPGARPARKTAPPAQIAIARDGSLSFAGRHLEPSELAGRLSGYPGKGELVIMADTGVDGKQLEDILNTARKAGYVGFGISFTSLAP